MNSALNSRFIQRVRNLSPFNESNYESTKLWTDFFNDYGTHVVKSAWGGGRIDIHVRSPLNIPVESFKEHIFQTVEFVEDLNALISGEKIDPKQLLPAGVNYSLVFHGGSQSYYTRDLAALSLEDASKMLNNWKKSLKFNPVVIPHQMSPIYRTARGVGLDKSEYIREASIRYFNSALSYVPPAPDPKVLEELARQQRENEEKLKELAEAKKRMEEQAERDRLAEVEAQRQRELEQKRLQEQRQREEQERQRRLERERQRLLRQQEEERRQAREEERRRQAEHQRQMRLIREREAEARRRAEEERRRLEDEEEEERRRQQDIFYQINNGVHHAVSHVDNVVNIGVEHSRRTWNTVSSWFGG